MQSETHHEIPGVPQALKTAALYVVATPLGNLRDISLRALEVLRGVDAIACEDTRHSARLMQHYGIHTRLFALHEHNEAEAAQKLMQLLQDGKTVALISDAGTPAISDPGARAVAAVRDAGYIVVPVPGPNAAVAAMCAAGILDPHFLFYGFLPVKPGARRNTLAALKSMPCALVFYEAPHRVVETVADLADVMEPQRTLVIARELTKLFETIVTLSLTEAPAWLAADDNRQRGEFVLIVSAMPPSSDVSPETLRVLNVLLQELPLKQAVKLAAEISGASKNTLYDLALAQKDPPTGQV